MRKIMRVSFHIGAPLLLIGGATGASAEEPPAESQGTAIAIEERYQRAEQFLSWNKGQYIRNDVVTPNWIGDKDAFWYTRTDDQGGTEFVHVDAASGERSPAFDQAMIASEISRLTELDVSAGSLPFASFQYNDAGGISFTIGAERFECSDQACDKSAVPEPALRPGETPVPGGQWAIYFKDDNLWQRALDGSADRALTSDGEPDNTYGISVGTDLSPVTRQRFGIAEAPLVVFSPDGTKALVQRIDQREVGMLHLLENAPMDGSLRPRSYSYRYAFAGDDHKPMASFHIFDLESGERIDVDYPAIPIPFVPHVHPLAPEVHWLEDGSGFIFVDRRPFGAGYSINWVDAASGETRELARREAEAHAFPAISVAMQSQVRLVGDTGVVWYSDESGYGHLYHTRFAGETRQLTSGDWNVLEILRVDAASGHVTFIKTRPETEGNPYHRQIARVDLSTGEMSIIGPEAGARAGMTTSFSPSGQYFVDNYSNAEVPGEAILRRSDGTRSSLLEQADVSALADLEYRQSETFTTLAADGETAIWGRILVPSDFDPERSYPIIDSIYPGPQRGRVEHGHSGVNTGLFDPYGEPQALAELGFVVVLLDGRGTPLRSHAFNYDAPASLLGEAGTLTDHIAAIRQLAETRPWMDLERVGIYGHSGGGFASTHALLEHGDFFKVAVSSAGNHEQRIYLPVWGESYLGADEGENYDLASNPGLAANLEGNLMLIAGNIDDNVHPAHTFQTAQALINAGKDFDLVVLSNANHRYLGNDNAYATVRTWNFLVEHLLGEEAPRHYAITLPGQQ